MPARRSNAEALLQKVNSQLRGERVPLKNKEENELTTYLNSLSQKTQQTRNVNLEEYSDLSTSGAADARNHGGHHSSSPVSQTPASPASRFLKKKPKIDASASQHIEGKETGGKNKKKAVLTESKKAPIQVKSALEKADALFRAGQASGLHRVVSRDSESEISMMGFDIGQRPDSADSIVGRSGLKFLKNQRAHFEDEKPALRSPSPQPFKRNFSHDTKADQRNDGKHKDEIVRTLGNQFVPSDQDSLAEFIQGLSVSESSSRRPPNLVTKKQQKWRKRASSSVSPSSSPVSRSPSPFKRSKSPFGKLSSSVSQDSDMMDLMDSEILEVRQGSDNSEDHFKITHMDVASLLARSQSPPRNKNSAEKHSMKSVNKRNKSSNHILKTSPVGDKERIKSPKSSASRKLNSQSNLFDSLGIHMADELLNFPTDNKDAELDISEESDIKTESSDRQKKIRKERQTSKSEIVTEIGDSERKASLFEQNLPETGVRKGSHDVDITDVEEYSDSFDTESTQKTASVSEKSRDRKSRSRTYLSQNGSHRHRDHKIVMEEVLVDVSAPDANGGTHHWNATHMGIHVSGPYGLQYVDPAPIATHVVSADALEVLTAYSPNMLALQEMMKAQLQLVQNFVDIQHRIYQSCMDGLRYDYKYTTLEDTKEYIRKNRKPRMTFKEALKLVEQEETATAT